jgi:hypothetical protein
MVFVALGALHGTPAWATNALMQRLPVSSRFQCLNCHVVQSPTSANATLNAFGEDFLANDSRWNAALAAGSSDGDNCTNGFELGDENGDGSLDDLALFAERKNPGQDDCTLQLDPKAWGALKKLFR